MHGLEYGSGALYNGLNSVALPCLPRFKVLSISSSILVKVTFFESSSLEHEQLDPLQQNLPESLNDIDLAER